MKKLYSIILTLAFVSGIAFSEKIVMAEEKEAAAEKTAESSAFKLGVPVGFSYASTYWWRGAELNGKGVGVMWPSVGLELGDTGLSFFITSGISTDMLADNGNYEKGKGQTELDYGMAYSMEIGKLVELGAGILFAHYPLVTGAPSGSFLEFGVSAAFKTILNPTIEVYYDVYVKENSSDTTAPKYEDFYIKLSVSHELISYKKFSSSAGAWLGYYNDPYFSAKGFSDAGLTIGFEYDYEGIAFNSSFNYGASLTKDFQTAGKHHFWSAFGVSYKFDIM